MKNSLTRIRAISSLNQRGNHSWHIQTKTAAITSENYSGIFIVFPFMMKPCPKLCQTASMDGNGHSSTGIPTKKWAASEWGNKPCNLGCHCCTIPQTNRTAASKIICIQQQSGNIRRRRNWFPSTGVAEHTENPAAAVSKYGRITADRYL